MSLNGVGSYNGTTTTTTTTTVIAIAQNPELTKTSGKTVDSARTLGASPQLTSNVILTKETSVTNGTSSNTSKYHSMELATDKTTESGNGSCHTDFHHNGSSSSSDTSSGTKASAFSLVSPTKPNAPTSSILKRSDTPVSGKAF